MVLRYDENCHLPDLRPHLLGVAAQGAQLLLRQVPRAPSPFSSQEAQTLNIKQNAHRRGLSSVADVGAGEHVQIGTGQHLQVSIGESLVQGLPALHAHGQADLLHGDHLRPDQCHLGQYPFLDYPPGGAVGLLHPRPGVGISKTASALMGSEKPMGPLAVSMRHFRPVVMPGP